MTEDTESQDRSNSVKTQAGMVSDEKEPESSESDSAADTEQSETQEEADSGEEAE